jgi:protein TonB
MHTHSSQSRSRVVLAVVIAAVHVAAGYALMNLRTRAPVAELQTSVAVHFISESPVRPQWQPPKVIPIQLPIDTRVPVIPPIEVPASPEPSHAITAQVVAAVTPAPARASEPAKLIASVEYLREPVPRYPPQSRKLREQGLVVLRVVIDERGTACDVAIENSSGHERLDRAAREAIARAEFRRTRWCSSPSSSPSMHA